MIQLPRPNPEWDDYPGGNDLYMQCVAWCPDRTITDKGMFCAHIVRRIIEKQFAHGDFLEVMLTFHAESMVREVNQLRKESYPDVPVQAWIWGFHLRRCAPHTVSTP